jgi:transcriptional regulator with XRE-family HTH domain
MNSMVAAQIKVLRNHHEMTQAQLAEAIGTKQAGISRLENVNYSSWKVDTLRRIAKAFRLRLKISFEEFGTLHRDVESFNDAGLDRRPFEEDPEFNELDAEAANVEEALAQMTPQAPDQTYQVIDLIEALKQRQGGANAQSESREAFHANSSNIAS